LISLIIFFWVPRQQFLWRKKFLTILEMKWKVKKKISKIKLKNLKIHRLKIRRMLFKPWTRWMKLRLKLSNSKLKLLGKIISLDNSRICWWSKTKPYCLKNRNSMRLKIKWKSTSLATISKWMTQMKNRKSKVKIWNIKILLTKFILLTNYCLIIDRPFNGRSLESIKLIKSALPLGN
jgi:hypothetical protein